MSHFLPTWVIERDGKRVPFEADKISQALFAATEDIGDGNAFLARELTDSVLHFLTEESGPDDPTTAQIAELVEKVVRQLGQPALAQAYLQRVQAQLSDAVATPQSFTFNIAESPADARRRCMTAYSLQLVYGRDIAAAHAEGLLILSGLEEPDRFRAVVDGPPDAAVLTSRGAAGQCLIFDAAELYFEAHGLDWLEKLALALDGRAMNAVLHLNVATQPRWSLTEGVGPLFANAPAMPSIDGAATHRLLTALLAVNSPCLRLAWHMQSSTTPILRIALDARDRLGLTVVVDRPRQPAMLGEGLERGCPAVLLKVTLDLKKFLARPEVQGDAERLLAKLPSLVRMAVRAGVQKRTWLRTHAADLSRGFLLDRARLVVTPLGLYETVQTLLHETPDRSPRSLDLACRITRVLADQLRVESRATNLDSVLDVGVTIEMDGTNLDARLHAAGELQRIAGYGSVTIASEVGDVASLLEAAHTAGVMRIGFTPTGLHTLAQGREALRAHPG